MTFLPLFITKHRISEATVQWICLATTLLCLELPLVSHQGIESFEPHTAVGTELLALSVLQRQSKWKAVKLDSLVGFYLKSEKLVELLNYWDGKVCVFEMHFGHYAVLFYHHVEHKQSLYLEVWSFKVSTDVP